MELAEKTNFELFVDTIESLKGSQGYYSRLADRLETLSEDELDEVKETMNNLSFKFKDIVDVVMYLEG